MILRYEGFDPTKYPQDRSNLILLTRCSTEIILKELQFLKSAKKGTTRNSYL